MEINFFFLCVFLQRDYLPVWLLSFLLFIWCKKKQEGCVCLCVGVGGGVILQLMAADSQLYCNHGMTHLEEIALHIALPWASIILTPGINGWVNGLQKSFNLCQAELRISNGFGFSKMSRQGISVQPIWEIKLSYYLFEWVFWTRISQYLMETVLTFITWLWLSCGLPVRAMTKGGG